MGISSVSWDNLSSVVDSRFLVLKPGVNEVRILSSALYPFKNHFIESRNRTVVCSDDGNCLLCKLGVKANQRYAVLVLERETGQVKVFERGIKVFRAIASLAKNSIWGDPRGYDVIIEKVGQGKQTSYNVIPQTKKPLTPSELQEVAKQVKEKGLSDLKDIFRPPTVEQVRQLLGEASEQVGEQPAPTTAPVAPVQPAQGAPVPLAPQPASKQPSVADKTTVMNVAGDTNVDDIFKALNI